MTRKHFLLSLLISVMILKIFISRAEYWEVFVYISIFLIPFLTYITWLADIQLRNLKIGCNVAGKDFSEKYKHLNKYL